MVVLMGKLDLPKETRGKQHRNETRERNWEMRATFKNGNVMWNMKMWLKRKLQIKQNNPGKFKIGGNKNRITRSNGDARRQLKSFSTYIVSSCIQRNIKEWKKIKILVRNLTIQQIKSETLHLAFRFGLIWSYRVSSLLSDPLFSCRRL